jgi:MFS family permease
VITAYLLASTAVAPVFGTLSDIYGGRATIIAAMSLFILGSILCAVVPNTPMLIVARGLQGLGGGGILPIVQTVISDIVTPRERGQYQAYFSGVWTAAGIGGPIIGGVFAEHLHWSMIFWINVPLGIASLAMLLPKMGKIPTFHRKRKVDWLGGVLLMALGAGFARRRAARRRERHRARPHGHSLPLRVRRRRRADGWRDTADGTDGGEGAGGTGERAGGDGGVGGPPAKHTGAGPRRKPKVARRAARVLRIWRSAIVAAG